MTRHAGVARWFSGLLLFVLLAAGVAPLNWDLPESRSRTSKIRVHPRGNLWATGHFMGKKSLESPQAVPLGTTPHTSLRDQRLLQLSHDLLRILRLKKALSMSFSNPAPQTQEAAVPNTAEVMPVMGQTQRDLECAHPGKFLNGTLVVTPSGCKS